MNSTCKEDTLWKKSPIGQYLQSTISSGFGILLLISCLSSCSSDKHLFILSGQSNMVGMNPAESFNPMVEKQLGKRKVLVVKDAHGGQPIRRWYRDWNTVHPDAPKAQPDLYDSLMVKVRTIMEDHKLSSVNFIWMQGERDAREQLGDQYKSSLIGLYNQLSQDLGRNDVHFVIGRLSDFDLNNTKYPHWTKVRDIQVEVANANPLFGWIDTDDLNDGINGQGKSIVNDLHMSVEGYQIMGERFAEKAIQLIQHQNKE